ncbi:MAG: bifunctional diguanylate cyclase/phosphodiesterase, partial [bacterium]|nr:bifunctional diguanylate cyclase/phosphodiesterase [bacterium]
GAGLALLWGAALMLIVDAATTQRRLPAPHERRLPAWFLVASVVVSVTLLAVPAVGDAEWAISIPALVTILAAAGRLAIALRDAREAAEARRLITTDEFTDLPNRRGLIADLNDRMTAGERFGLVLLDIDNFKEINDTYGREISDRALREIASRMQTVFPVGATVARIGGDDFVAVVPGDDVLEFMELANEIRASLLHDTRIDGQRIALRATLGIAHRIPADTRPTAILARADAALHDARQSGVPTLLYDPSRDEFAADRRAVSAALRAAIAQGGVSTWYQPKIDSRTQELLGLEASARWDDPERGRVPIGQLLATARRDGLMQELTEALLHSVLNDMCRWRAAGRDIPVTISVSAPELLNEVLLPIFYRQLAGAGLPDRAVTIAVPQEVFITEPERARSLIHDMTRAGFRVATVEDGDGFSSLGFLKDLPIAELKMGRSFLAGIGGDPRDRVLIASTVATAHALDMTVVVEGVDNDEQRSAAISANVDGLQGHLVGASMPAASVLDRVLGQDQPGPTLRIVR